MDQVIGQGVFSTLFADLNPDARSVAEWLVFALLVATAVSAALNPIFELLHRVSKFFQWLGRVTKGLFTRAPPAEPPPEPTREIPEERTIWEQYAPRDKLFPKTNGIPIITIANMKGGVGKTTITANLAVYLRDKLNKPVLLIDFDYQGSLTQTVRGEAGYTDPDITADILISPSDRRIDPPMYAREMRRGLENIFLYPTTYPFATIENNLMAEWIRDGGDLMYRLCALLNRNEYQSKYGAVLIDAPPRLTTGTINALCASTHLLVPTTLDDMSVQAATYFLDQISRMTGSVFPRLNVLGVAPSIIYGDSRYLIGEQRALDRLIRYGREVWKRDNFVLTAGQIPRTADISNHSGLGVAYLRGRRARQIFERLGAEIIQRLN